MPPSGGASLLDASAHLTLSAPTGAKVALHIGAIAFIYRFGSGVYEHLHFHVRVPNGGDATQL
jgi:hypothetical protein